MVSPENLNNGITRLTEHSALTRSSVQSWIVNQKDVSHIPPRGTPTVLYNPISGTRRLIVADNQHTVIESVTTVTREDTIRVKLKSILIGLYCYGDGLLSNSRARASLSEGATSVKLLMVAPGGLPVL